MKLSPLLALTATGLICSIAYAKAGAVALPEKVENSDLIARVEVLSTVEAVPVFEKFKDGKAKFRTLKIGKYRSRATVKVIQSVKGLKAGAIYTLEFDNGLACPNVHYKKGEECLVFNTKMPSGNYQTFNTYYGKYMVKENKVLGWKQVMKAPFNLEDVAFEDVADQITQLLPTPKKPE